MEKITNCPHNLNDTCEIASEIAGTPCSLPPGICTACEESTRPRRLNRYTVDLALTYNHDISIERMQSVIDGTSNEFGTRLSNTIGLILVPTPDCGCPGHKDILDVWTPKYVNENIEHVIAWLQYEAIKRSLPFSRRLCKLLLLGLLRTVR